MSNERIDQIMHEHDLDSLNTDLSPFHQKIYSRTVKAMEQYGSKCYEGGKKAARDICYEVLDPEITRLRSLVQAQKELIWWMSDRLNDLESYTEYEQLNIKIKELEK